MKAALKAFLDKVMQPFEEQDNLLSMRRCLALFFAIVALRLFLAALPYAEKGWHVFIPGGICVVATLLLLFFTTWSDITELVKGATGKKPEDPGAGLPRN